MDDVTASPTDTASADASSRLGEVAALMARLGVTAFGGPAAHIAMLHDEVVRRRGWVDDQHFLDLVGVTSLVPGPNSTEMTMHLGHERAGWRGLLVGGACFILPAAAIVAALAAVYVRYGATPSGQRLLAGVVPVVLAIIVQALVGLGRRAVTGVLTGVVALGSAAALLAGVQEVLVLAVGALVVVLGRRAATWRTGAAALAAWLPWRGGGTLLAQEVVTPSLPLGRLGLVFLKVGGLLYGSGYVLVAFLEGDLVDRLGVLTERQLLDAVAVGQFTPGPVFTTATFVGWVLSGPWGAVVATVAIFLPGFVFVALLQRYFGRVRELEGARDVLDGVNAAAVGLMAGVLVQLAGTALTGVVTVLLAVAAGLLLWRTRLNTAWLVAGGGVVGVTAGALGLL